MRPVSIYHRRFSSLREFDLRLEIIFKAGSRKYWKRYFVKITRAVQESFYLFWPIYINWDIRTKFKQEFKLISLHSSNISCSRNQKVKEKRSKSRTERHTRKQVQIIPTNRNSSHAASRAKKSIKMEYIVQHSTTRPLPNPFIINYRSFVKP